ncbi:TonB family protein [Salegentibacter sp. 24]|uniref:energy transducer TonB family protein n=1 Tax=Salegentibacter sp. 24 TaxID=2183986 RepID=UPI00105E7EF0|nr:energy transducer TonB [Salegentibacter sp. 24]TDN95575.1 TonB family protein [Salegentibacter sp. 24]
MDFFEKHKALIITVLFCLVLILGLYNFNLSQKSKAQQELLVDLENYSKEEDSKEEEIPDEKPESEPNLNSSRTHRAFNENQEAREENFDRKLDEILQENSAKQEENSENEIKTSSNGNIAKANKAEPKERSDGDGSTDKISTQNGGLINSSISFSLRGRSAVSIPNPIYTCDLPGRIVVNITVNTAGKVIETAINQASSSTDNACLTEKAQEYAANAVFSPLVGRNEQPGTITYNFKP